VIEMFQLIKVRY